MELQENSGENEEMNVCDNLGDHPLGMFYIKVLVVPSLGPRNRVCHCWIVNPEISQLEVCH